MDRECRIDFQHRVLAEAKGVRRALGDSAESMAQEAAELAID